MGRVILKVRDINLQINENNIEESNIINNSNQKFQELNKLKNSNSSSKNESFNLLNRNFQLKKLCRICYCNDIEVDSPLLNPCSCSGGVKYIHFSCLKQWLQSKCTKQINDLSITYLIKQYECELCKQILPDYVKYNNKLYEIWEFLKPDEKNYVVLESLVNEKDKVKSIYVLSFDKNPYLKLGRSHDTDLRIKDITVSRYHAIIKKNPDGSLTIEDNNSKFGLLILLKNPKVPIFNQSRLSLQCGGILLHFNIKNEWNFFSCFACGNVPEEDTVNYSVINYNYLEKNFNIKIQNDNELDEKSQSNNFNDNKSGDLSQNDLLTCNYEKEDYHSNELNFYITNKLTMKNQLENLNYIEKDNSFFIKKEIYPKAIYKRDTINFEINAPVNFFKDKLKKKNSMGNIKINMNNLKKFEEDNMLYKVENISPCNIFDIEKINPVTKSSKIKMNENPFTTSELSSVKDTERKPFEL